MRDNMHDWVVMNENMAKVINQDVATGGQLVKNGSMLSDYPPLLAYERANS
jgi:hypothetical protein